MGSWSTVNALNKRMYAKKAIPLFGLRWYFWYKKRRSKKKLISGLAASLLFWIPHNINWTGTYQRELKHSLHLNRILALKISRYCISTPEKERGMKSKRYWKALVPEEQEQVEYSIHFPLSINCMFDEIRKALLSNSPLLYSPTNNAWSGKKLSSHWINPYKYIYLAMSRQFFLTL